MNIGDVIITIRKEGIVEVTDGILTMTETLDLTKTLEDLLFELQENYKYIKEE